MMKVVCTFKLFGNSIMSVYIRDYLIEESGGAETIGILVSHGHRVVMFLCVTPFTCCA